MNSILLFLCLIVCSNCIHMTKVSRNESEILFSGKDDSYFYLTNSEYYPYSNYIFFYLTDKRKIFKYDKVKYCSTNIDPNSNPDSAVISCYFSPIHYYNRQSFYHDIGPTNYFYKFPVNSSYTYSIVYYELKKSDEFYVFSDYNDFVKIIEVPLN